MSENIYKKEKESKQSYVVKDSNLTQVKKKHSDEGYNKNVRPMRAK